MKWIYWFSTSICDPDLRISTCALTFDPRFLLIQARDESLRLSFCFSPSDDDAALEILSLLRHR